MSEKPNGGWLRRNVPAVVTWILIGLTAAATVGHTSATVGTVQEDVAKLKAQADAAVAERSTLRGDVRVQAERHAALTARVDRFERAMERLEAAANRLEALSNAHGRDVRRP